METATIRVEALGLIVPKSPSRYSSKEWKKTMETTI